MGQVGVDILGLGVPRGGAPLVLEKAGWVGLDFAQTETYCMCFSSNGKKGNEMTIYDMYIHTINCICFNLFFVVAAFLPNFFFSSCNLPAPQ